MAQTKATKVYRGIAGRALPKEFWQPNEYGVMGGVENAFMSSTVERRQQRRLVRVSGASDSLSLTAVESSHRGVETAICFST